ncbi:hypothetical protein M405DRAFT_880898 [Rhizopogon salebrosus TDB-379]|nr:hypothetical protein M405DRAFT_880898 [Rhizopogon salebrosus TDB-379]
MDDTLGVEDALARTNIRRKTQQRYQTAQRTQEAQEVREAGELLLTYSRSKDRSNSEKHGAYSIALSHYYRHDPDKGENNTDQTGHKARVQSLDYKIACQCVIRGYQALDQSPKFRYGLQIYYQTWKDRGNEALRFRDDNGTGIESTRNPVRVIRSSETPSDYASTEA